MLCRPLPSNPAAGVVPCPAEWYSLCAPHALNPEFLVLVLLSSADIPVHSGCPESVPVSKSEALKTSLFLFLFPSCCIMMFAQTEEVKNSVCSVIFYPITQTYSSGVWFCLWKWRYFEDCILLVSEAFSAYIPINKHVYLGNCRGCLINQDTSMVLASGVKIPWLRIL